jgi:hypothetical protein
MIAHMSEKIRVIVTIIAILELTKNSIISLAAVGTGDDVAIRQATPIVPLSVPVTA